jgi:hypothetical protein
MALRFRKSVKLMPGVRVTLGKKGISGSLGVTGARVGVNSKGQIRATAGLVGSGLSQTEVLNKKSRSSKKGPVGLKETAVSEERLIISETGAEMPSLDDMPNYNLLGGVIFPYFAFYLIVGSWAGYLVGTFTMIYWLYIKSIRLAVVFPSLFGVKTHTAK